MRKFIRQLVIAISSWLRLSLLVTGILLSVADRLLAQDGYAADDLAIGHSIPKFKLTDITHFRSKSATDQDFRGRWLVLEFWFTGCTSCLGKFPTINQIHNEFKDKLDWIMVGIVDNEFNKNTKAFYERVRARMSLEMPSAYDSVIHKQWRIMQMPRMIMVDPSGVIKVITNGADLTVDKMRALINNNEADFIKPNAERTEFAPLVTSTVLSSSVFTKWQSEANNGGYAVRDWVTLPAEQRASGFTLSMVPLYAIYNYAYIGRWDWLINDSLYHKIYPYPIIESSDSSLFKFDYTTGQGLYNYNVRLPGNDPSKEDLMHAIQQDLQRAFRLQASIETRQVKVYELVCGKKTAKLLASKGGTPYYSKGNTTLGFTFRNYSKSKLLNFLTFYIADVKDNIPYFENLPSVSDQIDFEIQADMTNLSEIRKSLQKYDMDIVPSTKAMQAIVIRDRGE